jgi:hypothetical protein
MTSTCPPAESPAVPVLDVPAGHENSCSLHTFNPMLEKLLQSLNKANEYLNSSLHLNAVEKTSSEPTSRQSSQSQANYNDSNDDLTEAPISKILNVNGKAAKTLDFSSNPNDPNVNVFGLGTYSLSNLKKMTIMDAKKLAEIIASDNADYGRVLKMMSDVEGKDSSVYLAYRLLALAEVQQYMKQPATKRRITLMKRG